MWRHPADAGSVQDRGGLRRGHRRERPDGRAVLSAERPFAELLAELAARSPAPGGGSASAWAGALAAALGEMAAAFADDQQAAARAAALRTQLLAAGERELSAYVPVLEASKLPKSDPSRKRRIDAALADATETPLAIARASAAVAELASSIAQKSTPALAGDAIVAVLVAEASSRAAGRLVEINLTNQKGDPRVAAVRHLVARAGAAREAALAGDLSRVDRPRTQEED
ncbi:MAG: cyclodeaminase/cyclohydrolase family protein [Solirubrobacterales bacterium]|nr:cyclodeaminase/cyclohydrolase family protein [Solirubrobacterales bacterium]